MSKRRGRYAYGYEFNKPLSGPQSKTVIRCYASHGIGYGKDAPPNSAIRLVAINAAREVRWVDAFYCALKGYVCEEMTGARDWRRLGYVLADGSQPHGEMDAVDPQMAQFEYLPLCVPEFHLGFGTAGIDMRSFHERTPPSVGDT